MQTSPFPYRDTETAFEGTIVLPDGEARHPAVLVCHAWGGEGESERATARSMAALGYVGITVDAYGAGRRGGSTEENKALMEPLLADRRLLRDRLLAAVSAAAGHPRVDPDRIAVIGFCFGGLCALDLARTADPRIKGAASFHGLFGKPDIGPQADITASILVLHGYADPMAPPAAMVGLADELSAAKADWQLIAYGHAMHGFTHVHANAPEMGIQYDAKADRRSRAALEGFLAELFAR